MRCPNCGYYIPCPACQDYICERCGMPLDEHPDDGLLEIKPLNSAISNDLSEDKTSERKGSGGGRQ